MEGNQFGNCTYPNSWKVDDPRLSKTTNRPAKPSHISGHQVNGDLHPNHGSSHGGTSSVKGHSRKDYKLLIDPAIKKGHHKVYRYDGALEGGQPITPRDPRPPKSKLWTFSQVELPVPRFKVDKYYVGQVPETTVRFGSLNDNVDKRFLHELCSKFGNIEECKVYYDPQTKKHSGTGKCVFTRSAAAKQAVSSLNGTSVMGNRIYVTLERPKPSDSKRHHGSHGVHGHTHNSHSHRRPSSSTSASSVTPESIALGQRDPRLLFSTPSPSPASSMECTPPTPVIGWNNRHHPVASLKPETTSGSGRRHSLTGRDLCSFPTPSPGSAISTPASATRSFEPVSPPPGGYPHHIQGAPLPPVPLPPSDKEEPPPPPPPPPNAPAKSSLEYEDISPSNNFDESHNSFSSCERSRSNRHGKDISPFTNSASGASLSSESRQKPVLPSTPPTEARPLPLKGKNRSHSTVSHSSKSSSSPALRSIAKDIKAAVYENIDSPDYKSKEFNLPKVNDEPTYEAISDSEEQQGDYEDISPVNSPQPLSTNRTSGHPRPASSPIGSSQLGSVVVQAIPTPAVINSIEANKGISVEAGDGEDNDDDDDAMSLSSISSNEDTPLELNTPAPTLQTSVAPPSSSVSSVPVPPLPFGARITVPPPPMYPPIPPPTVPVRRPLTTLPPGPPPPAPPPPPPPAVLPPYPRYPNYPPPGFASSQNMPPPVGRGMPMFYTSLFPQGVPSVRNTPLPPPSFSPGFMPPAANSPQKETKSQLPFKFQARESSSKAIDKDLKSVLSRDVMKRLVEQSGFKAFETWWDNQVKGKTKSKLLTASSGLGSAPSSIISPLTPCKVDNKEKASQDVGATSLISDFLGVLGKSCGGNTHSGFPKLPSFRIARKAASEAPVLTTNDTSRKRSASGSSDLSVAKSQRVDLSDEDDDEDFDDIGLASHIAKSKRDKMATGQGHIRESVSVYDMFYSSGSEEESDSDQEQRVTGKTEADITVKGRSNKEEDYERYGKLEDEEEDEDDDEEDDEEEEAEDDEEDFNDMDEMEEDEEEELSDDEYSSYSEEEEEEEEEYEELKQVGDEKGSFSLQKSHQDQRMSPMPQLKEEFSQNLHQVHEEIGLKGVNDAKDLNSTPSQLEGDILNLKNFEIQKDVTHEYAMLGKHEESVSDEVVTNTVPLKSFHDNTSHEVPVSKMLSSSQVQSENLDTVQKGIHIDGTLENKEISIINQREVDLETSEHNAMLDRHKGLQKDIEEETMAPESGLSVLPVTNNSQQAKEEVKNLWNNLFTEHSYSGLADVNASEGSRRDSGVVETDKVTAKEPVAEEPDYVQQTAYSDHETLQPKIGIESSSLYVNGDKDVLFPDSTASFNDLHPLLEEAKPYVSKFNFPMRTIEEENDIVNDILLDGLDLEDVGYLKKAFESLQLMGSDVVEGLSWCPHPETRTAPIKQKKNKSEPRLHVTGCARSEGYYKITDREKAAYLPSLQKQFITKGNDEVDDDKDGTKHKSQSRDNRVMQRRLASSFVNEDLGDLVKFNQFKIRKKHLRFAKSHIHNWGLFACEPIAAEEMVIEYVGEVIRSIAADQREKRYEEIGIGSSYLFRIDADMVIDATKSGNLARFINHCCTPNCYAKIISVEGEKKIVIYSKRDIKLNEEITYDYKFPIEDEKIPCLCGAPQCRGTLN